jgi:hypothetical protein
MRNDRAIPTVQFVETKGRRIVRKRAKSGEFQVKVRKLAARCARNGPPVSGGLIFLGKMSQNLGNIFEEKMSKSRRKNMQNLFKFRLINVKKGPK